MKLLPDWLYLLRKTFLTRSSRRHYSQFGEDVVLLDWLHDREGFFVDVGCYHPSKFSNTYALYRRGWRGINIDMDEIKVRAFAMARPDDINVHAAVSDEPGEVSIHRFSKYGLGSMIVRDDAAPPAEQQALETVRLRTRTLDEIIEATVYKNRQIDLLTVDAEGHDLEVLRSLSFDTYKPKLILVELHTDGIDEVLASPLHRFLAEKGYTLCNWVGLTLFYRRSDLRYKAFPA
ncbi:MAG TPA: FkbM family methyltransferase [Mariprofundaceae bacterium]|nr:FkbM family methyltransferase [Mariprofundaceae bacterium]